MTFLGYLKELLIAGRKRFFIDDTESQLQISVQELDRFLIYLINEEILKPVIQIICPQCQITVNESEKGPPKDKKYHCDICESEFTFSDAQKKIAMEFIAKNLDKVPFFRARRKMRMANRI